MRSRWSQDSSSYWHKNHRFFFLLFHLFYESLEGFEKLIDLQLIAKACFYPINRTCMAFVAGREAFLEACFFFCPPPLLSLLIQLYFHGFYGWELGSNDKIKILFSSITSEENGFCAVSTSMKWFHRIQPNFCLPMKFVYSSLFVIQLALHYARACAT